jgi:hypothetical protein
VFSNGVEWIVNLYKISDGFPVRTYLHPLKLDLPYDLPHSIPFACEPGLVKNIHNFSKYKKKSQDGCQSGNCQCQFKTLLIDAAP